MWSCSPCFGRKKGVGFERSPEQLKWKTSIKLPSFFLGLCSAPPPSFPVGAMILTCMALLINYSSLSKCVCKLHKAKKNKIKFGPDQISRPKNFPEMNLSLLLSQPIPEFKVLIKNWWEEKAPTCREEWSTRKVHLVQCAVFCSACLHKNAFISMRVHLQDRSPLLARQAPRLLFLFHGAISLRSSQWAAPLRRTPMETHRSGQDSTPNLTRCGTLSVFVQLQASGENWSPKSCLTSKLWVLITKQEANIKR